LTELVFVFGRGSAPDPAGGSLRHYTLPIAKLDHGQKWKADSCYPST